MRGRSDEESKNSPAATITTRKGIQQHVHQGIEDNDDLIAKGIRVNAVAPGPIWTPLIPATFDKKHVAEFGKSTPMGRPGQPSEVGPAYVFLASEDASYISGQVIHINGGNPVN